MLYTLSILLIGCAVVDSFSIVRIPSNQRNKIHTKVFYNVQRSEEVAVPLRKDDTFVDTSILTTPELRNERQSIYAAMVRNYTITDMFQPVPWLQNNHIQTIGGYIFRKLAQSNQKQHAEYNLAYIPRNEPWYQTVQRMIEAVRAVSNNDLVAAGDDDTILPFWDRRERINTPDGDFFHVDIKRSRPELPREDVPPTSIVLLLHGLQSNSQSPVCMEMASAILQQPSGSLHQRYECHCINFRGCSGVPNDTVGGYHLGYTEDVKYYLQQLYQLYRSQNIPYPPIYITGFSLGANVALKCIGELGSMAQDVPYHIHGAAVLCVPLDQVADDGARPILNDCSTPCFTDCS